jgi:hypothetical protein
MMVHEQMIRWFGYKINYDAEINHYAEYKIKS